MNTSIYAQSADIYDVIYRFLDYEGESKKLQSIIQQYQPNAKTLLDLACGTGKHLEFLRQSYQVEGLDINPGLLSYARRRCPEILFHQGDMIDFSLPNTFDVITCLFSSIGYVRTIKNLDRAIDCMSRHLSSGGIVLVVPWFSPESYWTNRVVANYVNDPDMKIAMMYTSEAEGRVSINDIHYLVGMPSGITHFTERNEMGLFTKEEYTEAFQKADLQVVYDSNEVIARGLYVGKKNEG